jgi:hypothetical protein
MATRQKREDTKGIAKKLKQKKEFTRDDKIKFEALCAKGYTHDIIAFNFRTSKARLYERVFRAYDRDELKGEFNTGNEIIDYFRAPYKQSLHDALSGRAFGETGYENCDTTALIFSNKVHNGYVEPKHVEVDMNVNKVDVTFSDDDYTK